jgi:hypothetical protein
MQEMTNFECRLFRRVKHTHRGSFPRYAKKAMNAIISARKGSYSGAVVLIDRDGRGNAQRRKHLEQGRDNVAPESRLPCAVGVAVETFDAWMIADADAVEEAGGDKTHTHPDPEKLDGDEGTQKHPKDFAAAAFGGLSHLGQSYASVAETADLDLLVKRCPDGFASFRKDVEQHLGELREQPGAGSERSG